MEIGKLSDKELNELVLSRLPKTSSNVKEGPGTGLDCGIINIKGSVLAVSSDPITGAAENIGRLAVHISCNDIASCGIRPEAMTIVLILPPTATRDDLMEIIDDLAEASEKLSVDIVGGHTEISNAVVKPLLMTTAFGTSQPGQVVHSFGSQVGDSIIMTKYCAIEGTSILAHDYEDRLRGILSQNDIDFSKDLINQISVVDEGILCGRSGIVHAMHDATEGGILGAAGELAISAGKGCIIDISKIPVYDETVRVCEFFGLNPYRLISSGSMLISTDEPDKIIRILADKGIKSAVIGEITEEGLYYIDFNGEKKELSDTGDTGRDELYKVI